MRRAAHAWQSAASSLAFLRANRGHTFRDSFTALLPTVLEMACTVSRVLPVTDYDDRDDETDDDMRPPRELAAARVPSIAIAQLLGTRYARNVVSESRSSRRGDDGVAAMSDAEPFSSAA